MGITERLANFIVEASFDAIPKEAVTKAKSATLDCLGVILAAVNDPIGEIIIKYTKERGGTPEASVIGGDFRTSAEMAALANGTMCHALDYDDVGLSVGHPSICIVPTALSIGEKLNSSGKEILEALIIGYEIAGKIGFGSKYVRAEKGLHTAPVFGTIGAAAVAAKLLKLDVNQVRAAFGIAASQVAGLSANAGTMTKPLHAGTACRAGVMSALLAKEGFTGDANIIETSQGYGDSFFGKGNYDEQKMVEKLGNPFHIISHGITVKKYPCCMLNHRALDSILQLIEGKDIKHEQVAAIIVGVPRNISPLRPDAHTGLEGKFCLPYTMAAALVDRKINLGTFTDEMVQRPIIREIMSKVQLQLREDVPIYNGSLSSGRAGNPITVRLKDGKTYENQVNIPRGTPEAPLTLQELSDKYRDCAQNVLSRKQLERSIEMVLTLEEVKNIGELMNVVTKGPFS
ncbi:MAG: MmgE/PrpD family protein [Pseudomonadota bacterium]